MKQIILSLCLFASSLAYTQTEGLNLSDAEAQNLATEMYSFFTNTLQDKYSVPDEAELYQKFLTEYFDSRINQINNFHFDINIDKKQLQKINKRLFIRDYSHYYFFFPEVMLLEQNDDLKVIQKKFCREHPHAPAVFIQSLAVDSSRHIRSVKDFYGWNSVKLTPGCCFIRHIESENSLTNQTIISSIKNYNEIPLFYFATAFIKGEAGEELKLLKTRMTVAIIFWKFLCLEADVDFHKPLKVFLEY
jgi:hypothetical protein